MDNVDNRARGRGEGGSRVNRRALFEELYFFCGGGGSLML